MDKHIKQPNLIVGAIADQRSQVTPTLPDVSGIAVEAGLFDHLCPPPDVLPPPREGVNQPTQRPREGRHTEGADSMVLLLHREALPASILPRGPAGQLERVPFRLKVVG